MKTTTLIATAVLFTLSAAVAASATTAVQGPDLVNIELKDVSVKEAIARLFEGRGLSYVAEGSLTRNVVELKFKGITFDQALKALTDAAGLTYTVDEGTYIIRPADKVASAKSALVSGSTYPQQSADSQAPALQPDQQPPAPSVTPSETQAVVDQQASPVYYGQTAQPGYPSGGYGYGYGYPYRIGNNIEVVSGGWGNPIVVTGTGPSMLARRYPPPPPPGWVPPDALGFLRFQYGLPGPYIGYPVSYGW